MDEHLLHENAIGMTDPAASEQEAQNGEQAEWAPGTGGFVGSVMNLSNAALGAGILSFPVAFAQTGIILGLILSSCFAVALGFTLSIIARASLHYKASSYQGAVVATAGPVAGFAIMVSMTLYLLGACIAYLNVIMDQAQPVLCHIAGSASPFCSQRLPLLAICAACLLPLCLLRNISFLSTPSTLAVVSIIYMAALVTVDGAHAVSSHQVAEGVVAFRWSSKMLQAIPVVCFALQCHLVAIPVFAEMKTRTVKRANLVTLCAFAICMALYVPTGILGYAKFGPSVDGDVLTSFPLSSTPANVARVCIGVTALMSYPLLHFVARLAIIDLLRWRTPVSFPRWGGTAVLFLGTTVTVATLVPKVKTVLEFTGATGAVAQIFIFPGLMLISGKMPNHTARDVRLGWVSIIFGIAVAVACTTVAIQSL